MTKCKKCECAAGEWQTGEHKRCPSFPGYSVCGDKVFSHWKQTVTGPTSTSTWGLKLDYNYCRELRGDRQRYMRVKINVNGKKVTRFKHTLITDAYLGPKPEGLETRHLDGNPFNNNPNNLRYATHKENEADKITHGTLLYGESHPLSKVTDSIVREMRNKYVPHIHTVTMLMKEYGLSSSCIEKIVSRRTWGHVV